MALVDSTAPAVISFVGDVPAQNSVSFTLVGPSNRLQLESVHYPIGAGAYRLRFARQYINGSGGVTQVLQWNAGRQEF